MLKKTAAGCVIALALLCGPQAAATEAPAPGQAGYEACFRPFYQPEIRAVRGRVSVQISRMKVTTYPGTTVIDRGRRVKTQHRRTLRAGLNLSGQLSAGASGVFKRVVDIFVDASVESSFRSRFSSTKRERRTVVNRQTVRVPGGTSVVWFVAHKQVKGSFRYTTCDYSAEEPRDTGRVTWHRGRWSSFSVRDDGGQRCDLPADTAGGRLAKRIGCL